ncbi:SDR family oxidoreductase [Starkeya koreensis]|uniref:dTDP-4-dehydrorhamnose reductase n=1 Tax=Ancylobacter koreensis TaxID=266121 RepID=A0ABT0DKG7_9HYPH|nr:SDR family oxidoreductase [Ancylobacter koreensis]
MKVVVLGVTGMLGNAAMRVLAREPGIEVFGVSRRPVTAEEFPGIPAEAFLRIPDVAALDAIGEILARTRADAVINAIGIVKQLQSADDPLVALPINALLPHQLARLCAGHGARLIHVSTDCVFDGRRGAYTEADVANATDLYGRSKLLGEVDAPNALTLRTSIIGHELGSRHGLIDWFLGQEGSVYGFTRAIFSGLTTVELTRVIARHVLPDAGLRGLYHVSAAPISKFDLLSLAARVYGKSVAILPRDEPVIDRSLNSDRFRQATGYRPPDWPTLLEELRTGYGIHAAEGVTRPC